MTLMSGSLCISVCEIPSERGIHSDRRRRPQRAALGRLRRASHACAMRPPRRRASARLRALGHLPGQCWYVTITTYGVPRP